MGLSPAEISGMIKTAADVHKIPLEMENIKSEIAYRKAVAAGIPQKLDFQREKLAAEMDMKQKMLDHSQAKLELTQQLGEAKIAVMQAKDDASRQSAEIKLQNLQSQIDKRNADMARDQANYELKVKDNELKQAKHDEDMAQTDRRLKAIDDKWAKGISGVLEGGSAERLRAAGDPKNPRHLEAKADQEEYDKLVQRRRGVGVKAPATTPTKYTAKDFPQGAGYYPDGKGGYLKWDGVKATPVTEAEVQARMQK